MQFGAAYCVGVPAYHESSASRQQWSFARGGTLWLCACSQPVTSYTGNAHSYGMPFSLLKKLKHRRSHSGRKSLQRTPPVSASLGFSADPRVGIERAASALMKDVASLLVFQDIFRSPQAQAFLKVLLALRRGDDALKLLDSYGEFFRLMAVGGYSSWEDYILDGILIGEANPFAEAAASLGYPLNPWFGQIPPSLEAAAAADLEALQRLSITESTLSGWVLELADAKPEWRSAVTSSLSCHNGHKHLDDDEAHIGLSGLDEDNKRHSDKEDLLETSKVIDNLVINREMWRKRIGGLWKWSEAMPLLKEYYPKHGVGRVATSQVLLLKGGKLVSDLKFFYRGKNHCELTVHRSQRQDIIGFLREHSLKYSPNHLLLVDDYSLAGLHLLPSSSLFDTLLRMTNHRLS